jgi:ribosomal protein S18 acetylase RimI-like enzyme
MVVNGVVEVKEPAASYPQGEPCRKSPHISVRVRPIVSSDLRPLMRSVGPLVDALYPTGAALLLRRLEDALAGHAIAYVVASTRTDLPIALAAEVFKGHQTRKLSTFWVSPSWRRQGIGSLLASDRVQSWISGNLDSVHVTVRESRSPGLMALLGPLGFRSELVEANRYGEARNEVILRWRPEYMSYARSAGSFSLQCAS